MMVVSTAILLLIYSFQLAAHAQKCGFESCAPIDPTKLNVHVVPHTHDDVGWLKTVDEYFYGSRNNYQDAAVQYVLDGVIDELSKNPDRKFTYVEMAFFYRWWIQQNAETQALVKKLVSNGQLHFTVGGWSMADEAATHYVSLIDQHALGFRLLSDNFGECGRPLAAWQIDPFGHSREVAHLFAQFGYNGLYLGRIDYQDKDARMSSKQLEQVWKGSDDFDSAAHNIFTGITYDGYGPLGGFCWDQWCGDDPVMDDPRLHDYNVDERVSEFVNAVRNVAKNFNTNNVMLTMGSDFMWMNALKWYKNLDKIIKYVNEKSNETGVRAFYSTPACYTYGVNQAGKTYKVKTDDFFPYAHTAHAFWTGYFTSRAAFKGFVREAESYFQSFRQLHSFALLGDLQNTSDSLFTISEALGLAQHHDAVSGTEKQHVVYDYTERLQAGLDACVGTVLQSSYNRLMPRNGGQTAPAQTVCAYLNVSVCSATSSKQSVAVTLYNPYAQPTTSWLRLPVSGAVKIVGPDGQSVASQLVPISDSTRAVWKYMNSGNVPAPTVGQEVVFETKLPALGWSTYLLSSSAEEAEAPRKKRRGMPRSKVPQWLKEKMSAFGSSAAPEEASFGTFEELALKGVSDYVIKNPYLALHFDTQSGRMTQLDNLAIGKSFDFTPTLKYYLAMDNSGVGEPSGAYLFRSFNDSLLSLGAPKVSYVQGNLVQEVWQTYGSWASVVTRLYNDANYAELEWTVGPIDVSDKWGRELVMEYQTSLDNNKTCWTDANGRQLMKRVFNYRPTWSLQQSENVSGNYYPVNSRILLRDSQNQYQLTVLTDRSAGGGCVRPGSVEVMLHRRLLNDDHLGVGEPLNEPGLDGKGLIVRGKHLVIFDSVPRSAALHRDLATRKFAKPLISFAANSLDFATYSTRFRTQFSGLARQLPPNVHLLTLAFWRNVSATELQVLARFEHIYQKNEDASLSQSASFNLQNLFTGISVTGFDTLTLGANQKASDAKRLDWNLEAAAEGAKYRSKRNAALKYDPELRNEPNRQSRQDADDDWQITLQPMEIRTLLLNVTLA